jgi:hypothetical protein
MLHVLTSRQWGHDQGEAAAAAPGNALSSLFEAAALSAPLVLVGHLQDAYLNFQLVVSGKFARCANERALTKWQKTSLGFEEAWRMFGFSIMTASTADSAS